MTAERKMTAKTARREGKAKGKQTFTPSEIKQARAERASK